MAPDAPAPAASDANNVAMLPKPLAK